MNLLEQLEQELKIGVEKILELEDQKYDLELALGTLYKEKHKLQKALDALQGREESPEDSAQSREAVEEVEREPRVVLAPTSGTQRPRVEVDTRLPCGACGGRLEPATRTLNSGKIVSLLMCTDSGCNNEIYS